MFKKLGHFVLDDNQANGFLSRELKTVFVDITCQYFKI